MAAVERARAALDNPAFTTDVIVGFPGETDTYFQESHEFCKNIGFSQMHIFTYSPRPKTMAAKMGRQVNGAVAAERSEKLQQLRGEMALAYHKQFIGKPVDVLIERVKDGIAQGYSEHYVPVHFPSETARKRDVVQVRAVEADKSGIRATA